MKSWISTLLISMASCLAVPIDDGVRLYQEGDYKGAAKEFQDAIAENGTSAGLYYNLGMAQKQDEDLPQAALNLRRALILDPHLADARVALSDVERNLGVPLSERNWKDWAAETLPLETILILGFVFFWLGAFVLLVGLLTRRRQFGFVAFGLLLALLGTFLYCSAYLADPRYRVRDVALITATEPVSLSKTPTTRSESVAQLPPASMVTLTRQRGDWVYAQLPDGRSGWLPKAETERLIPSEFAAKAK